MDGSAYSYDPDFHVAPIGAERWERRDPVLPHALVEFPVTLGCNQLLQNVGVAESFGRNRRPATCGIHFLKVAVHSQEHLVGQRPDTAEQLVPRSQRLDLPRS